MWAFSDTHEDRVKASTECLGSRLRRDGPREELYGEAMGFAGGWNFVMIEETSGLLDLANPAPALDKRKTAFRLGFVGECAYQAGALCSSLPVSLGWEPWESCWRPGT